MSAKQGGKRISVFDRLGPGNDEDGHSIPHRRIPNDTKTVEKRHSVGGSGRPSHLEQTPRDVSRSANAAARHRQYHVGTEFPGDEDLSNKAKPRRRPIEVIQKELTMVAIADKIKSGNRSSCGEGDSVEPEDDLLKKRPRLSVPDEWKDAKLVDKKDKYLYESVDGPHPRLAVGEGHGGGRGKEDDRHDRKRKRDSPNDDGDNGDGMQQETKKMRLEDRSKRRREEGKGGDGEGDWRSKESASVDDKRAASEDDRHRELLASKKYHRERDRGSSDSEAEPEVQKASDWGQLPGLLQAFPLLKPTTSATVATSTNTPVSAFERLLSPGAILSRTGISPYLAGPDLYQKACQVVSSHLKTVQGLDVAEPFGMGNHGSTGLSFLEFQLELLSNVYASELVSSNGGGVGSRLRALTTATDCAVRRKLRRNNAKVLLSSQPTVTRWEPSAQYRAAVGHYLAAESNAAAPCYKIKESAVGSIVVAR